MSRINTKRSSPAVEAQIGLRLRTMRIDQGISQETLAKQLGLTFQQVQKYEKGTNRLALSRAMNIAKALNTTVNELIGIDGAEITDTKFDYQAYRLAQSFKRLNGLSPEMSQQFRSAIDTACDELEKTKKKDVRRGRGRLSRE
jgi:transcriptional regulator with XRE-family HTH domain